MVYIYLSSIRDYLHASESIVNINEKCALQKMRLEKKESVLHELGQIQSANEQIREVIAKD